MESLATIESNGVTTTDKDIEESPSPTAAADTNGNLAASCASPSPSGGSSAPEATSAPSPSAITDAVTNTARSSTPLADTLSGVVHAGEPKPAGGSTSKNKKKKKKKVSSASSGTSAPVPETPTPRTSGVTENGDSREDMSSVRAETRTAGGARGEQQELGKADSGSGVGAAGAAAAGASNGADILRLLKKQQIEKLVAKAEAKANKEHKFWDTQPMKKPGEDPEEPGEIETKTIQDVNPEPCSMPAGFEWCHVDVMDEAEAEEVYTLLSENYVEDDDNMFRFDYSKEFLRWALTPPGYSAELHVGVRSSKGKLMALITAVPTQMRVVDASIRTVEINFLCVHKKLRSKRLAPVLIKEITRRVNRRGVWQAVYTAGVVLPTPLACCRYFHRSLNPKKLIEVGFSRLSNRMTMARTLKLYKLPDRTNSANISVMTAEDVPSVHSLLTEYLKQFKLAPEMTEEEIGHWLLPREGVVDCFVVRDSSSGKVTDMCSFYHLPSTVIGHQKHRTLNAAYSFYNVATTVSMTELMRDSLILARNLGMDVFNALNLMQNKEFLQTLKFGIGDGHLQYYLYNWRCKEIMPEEVGLVLL